jgi:hypothetical protein
MSVSRRRTLFVHDLAYRLSLLYHLSVPASRLAACTQPRNGLAVGAAQVCRVRRRIMPSRTFVATNVTAAPPAACMLAAASSASTSPNRAAPPLTCRPRAISRPVCRRAAVPAPGPTRQAQTRSQKCPVRPGRHGNTCLATGSRPDNRAGVGLYLIHLTFRPRMRPAILLRRAAHHTPPFRSLAGERAWTRSPFA